MISHTQKPGVWEKTQVSRMLLTELLHEVLLDLLQPVQKTVKYRKNRKTEGTFTLTTLKFKVVRVKVVLFFLFLQFLAVFGALFEMHKKNFKYKFKKLAKKQLKIAKFEKLRPLLL